MTPDLIILITQTVDSYNGNGVTIRILSFVHASERVGCMRTPGTNDQNPSDSGTVEFSRTFALDWFTVQRCRLAVYRG